MNVESRPEIQKFFMFDKNIDMCLIKEAVLYLKDTYLKNSKENIYLTTFDEKYTDLSLNNIIDFNDKKDNLEMLNIHLNDAGMEFSLTMQFNNDTVGPNGNYSIKVSTKQVNTNIEKYIREKLSLRKYMLDQKSQDNQEIIVRPIFNERDFSSKEKHCFILMPFSEDWSNRVQKCIGEILRKNGYSYSRADNLFGHNILEDIWVAINESSLILADITSRNPNVFYEIGIAHTLGKKVILLAQEVTDIPFDFKNYRHIIYKDNTDGFEILNNELPNYLDC